MPCEGQPGNDAFCGYTQKDNSYEVMPKTCNTVYYDWTITNTTLAPDGVSRIALTVNGQMPGPKLEASWGDTIVVKVTNALQNNGTAMHFHGMRQNYTNEMDGVPSITQCPIAPGDSMTYTFKATNYGLSWYHSHFGLQAYEGVFGPMVIKGPLPYDYASEQTITLQDWNHVPLDSIFEKSQQVSNGGRQPTLATGLINGMNVFNGAGQRFSMTVAPGSTVLLRVVNTAVQSTFKFFIDGHKFKVIANDYVPIVPYETNILNINNGQRYDILVTFDQTPGDYWMHSDNQAPCSTITNTDIKGIVHYTGHTGTPTSTAYTYTAECVDEPYASLVPVAPLTVGGENAEIHKSVTIQGNGGNPNLYRWFLSGTPFQANYADPTLNSIIEHNGTVPNYSGNLAISVPNLGEWVYVIIESPIPLPHPIHLHGHDFFILAQGTGAYPAGLALNTVNPPRRDVAVMPWNGRNLGGYLVVAFKTDNPGVWLMHCHIGWHASMGFALQIIENLDGIAGTIGKNSELEETCEAYGSYYPSSLYEGTMHDAGI